MATRNGSQRLFAVLAALSCLVLVASCAGEDAEVDESLVSGPQEAFEIVTLDGEQHVVGHGVTMQMSEGWTDYEPEKDSVDGTTHEWAVGLPADTEPLPAGVQFSMGKPGKGASFETMPTATRELAELAPGYELLDEGEVDVPGADGARFLRYERDLEYGGTTVRVNQLQLILDMPSGAVSVLRFIAEEDKWEQQMEAAFDSLVVAEADSA